MAREDVASNMAGPHRQPDTPNRLPSFERCTVVPDLTAVCALTGTMLFARRGAMSVPFADGTDPAMSARVKASSSLK
jgi:hypothetical protein